jgi:hypothetical protein
MRYLQERQEILSTLSTFYESIPNRTRMCHQKTL